MKRRNAVWSAGSKTASWSDYPQIKGYGEILKKIINQSSWQRSDYLKPTHPFYKKILDAKDQYKILESYYFDTKSLKLLLVYLENDLDTKMQRLIDNPPVFEKDHPLYDEPFTPVSISFKEKVLETNDFFLQTEAEVREAWGLSNTVKSLQDEINKNGGLYLVYAELIENEIV